MQRSPENQTARPFRYDVTLFEPLPWPEKEDQRGDSGLYFVQAETGQIKVGRTHDMRARLRELQAFSPVPLRLVGWVRFLGWQLERHLHAALSPSHLHSEWFAPTPEVCEAVERARADQESAFEQYATALPKKARRTHCKRGHELTEENVRIDWCGARVCRRCATDRQIAYLARKKAASIAPEAA